MSVLTDAEVQTIRARAVAESITKPETPTITLTPDMLAATRPAFAAMMYDSNADTVAIGYRVINEHNRILNGFVGYNVVPVPLLPGVQKYLLPALADMAITQAQVKLDPRTGKPKVPEVVQLKRTVAAKLQPAA